MQARRLKYSLPRHSSTACTRNHRRARFPLPPSLDLQRRRFFTVGAVTVMDPQTTASTSTNTSNPQVPSQAANAEPLPLVMQIVVRRDLFDKEKWGAGPLMAQAAHAATAILHLTRRREETIEYLADFENMRKVVLQTPDLSTLKKLTDTLSHAGPSPIPHHLWTEQPEDIPTCIALAPNRKEKPIRKALDKASCRLWQSD